MRRYGRTVPSPAAPADPTQPGVRAGPGGAAAVRLALVSWAVFVLALGLAGVATAAARVVDPGREALGGVGLDRVVPAAVVLLVTVPSVLVVHRRHRALLALGRPLHALTGAAVVLLAAVAVFAVDAAAGGTQVVGVDVPALLRFLLVNTLLALALEAVPEEIAFRGGVLGALARWPAVVAAAATTALFVVAPAASIAVTWVAGSAVGLDVPAATFAPEGQDPVAYAVALAAFGLVLVAARLATGSVWACVGLHVVVLTVNRTLLEGSPFGTGVDVVSPPGAELLVLGYLALTGAVLVLMARRRRRARGGPDLTGPAR